MRAAPLACSATLHGLLPRPRASYDALPALKPMERVLVLGAGGGCDVFAAAEFARALKAAAAPHDASSDAGPTVLYANCVGERPLEHLDRQLDHLFLVPPARTPLDGTTEAYGTTLLEESCPRGDEGSPYVIRLPAKGGQGLSVAEVTTANSRAVHDSLQFLRVDRVFAVDCGGDGLTGGVDFAESVELGRDRQVHHALASSGLAYQQIVVSPGCDAESSVEAMSRAVADVEAAGRLVGVLDLTDMAPRMGELSAALSPDRTTNLIASAARHCLAGDAGNVCRISRHGSEATIPYSWLTVALVIEWAASSSGASYN